MTDQYDVDGSPITLGRRAHWWRRLPAGPKRYRFVDEHGEPVRDANALERVRHLAIPPAWTEVRVSPYPRSRLQAIGLDSRGRPQYIYHAAFAARQARKKFAKIERFGEYLPRLRARTNRDITLPGYTKDRVLAIVTRLVNRLYFRVGSEDNVKENRTYGITTLRKGHLRIGADGRVSFSFDGKHHVRTRRILVDPELAHALRGLLALKGHQLFKYVDAEGRIHSVTAHDVNEYVKQATAPEFSAKDFRTWHGTLLVAKELARIGKATSQRQCKRNVAQAVRNAAAELGNTPAVCRRSYLHPLIVELYNRGITLEDVPLGPDRIRAVEAGQSPDELQLLELFLLGRELRARGRPQMPVHAPPPALPAPAPVPLLPESLPVAIPAL